MMVGFPGASHAAVSAQQGLSDWGALSGVVCGPLSAAQPDSSPLAFGSESHVDLVLTYATG
jgi:hypothetical protein